MFCTLIGHAEPGDRIEPDTRQCGGTCTEYTRKACNKTHIGAMRVTAPCGDVAYFSSAEVAWSVRGPITGLPRSRFDASSQPTNQNSHHLVDEETTKTASPLCCQEPQNGINSLWYNWPYSPLNAQAVGVMLMLQVPMVKHLTYAA